MEYFLNHFKPELLTDDVATKLSNLKQSIPNETVLRVKEIEKTTNHDVKAVELALSESFDGNEAIQSLIHIFLTSEDINSASYALMLKEMHSNTLEWIENLEAALGVLIDENAELPMMARTHGHEFVPSLEVQHFHQSILPTLPLDSRSTQVYLSAFLSTLERNLRC